jgi:serine/threonine-protein kinase HipA
VLETDGGYCHLLIPRFDLGAEGVPGGRLHQHTLGGLLHLDYNEPGASSYEEYLRTILSLGMPQAALNEGYRRAVFNVVARNQDDHVKNLSFHMNPDGQWRLTPAYDVTFAAGSGYTARHQMRLADKLSGITRADLLELGRRFSVKDAAEIVEQMQSVVADWPRYAAGAGVPADSVRAVGEALEARRQELA